MTSRRLPDQPGEVIDRTDIRRFSWNRKEVSGMGGDTVASALAASGVSVFSRSFSTTYHEGS